MSAAMLDDNTAALREYERQQDCLQRDHDAYKDRAKDEAMRRAREDFDGDDAIIAEVTSKALGDLSPSEFARIFRAAQSGKPDARDEAWPLVQKQCRDYAEAHIKDKADEMVDEIIGELAEYDEEAAACAREEYADGLRDEARDNAALAAMEGE